MALKYSFFKENARPDAAVLQRSDVVAFFKAYGTNGLTQFKREFSRIKLFLPGRKPVEYYDKDKEDHVENVSEVITKEDIEKAKTIYDENFEALKKMSWKFVRRPGGQAIRPPAWYKLKVPWHKSKRVTTLVSVQCGLITVPSTKAGKNLGMHGRTTRVRPQTKSKFFSCANLKQQRQIQKKISTSCEFVSISQVIYLIYNLLKTKSSIYTLLTSIAPPHLESFKSFALTSSALWQL